MKQLFTASLLSVLLFASCGGSENPEAEADSGAEDKAANDALKVAAVIADISTSRQRILTTGTVLADEEVNLMSEISGRIETINFVEGQNVKRGDVLVKLVNDDLKAEYQKAKYEMKLQQDREGRQRKLLEISAVSQEAYDTELNRLNVLRSDLNLLEAQIAKTEIRAPFDGTVGLRYVSPGAIVSTTTSIAALQKVKPVKIEFSVPERYGRRVKIDGTVNFTVSGIADTLDAVVYAREPQVDANSRSLRFRARYDNTDELLLPGGFVNISLELTGEVEVVEIPGIALVPEIKGAKVYVIEKGLATNRNVEIVNRDADVVRISSGLSSGDTVVVSGLMQVRAGMKVEADLSAGRKLMKQETEAAE